MSLFKTVISTFQVMFWSEVTSKWHLKTCVHVPNYSDIIALGIRWHCWPDCEPRGWGRYREHLYISCHIEGQYVLSRKVQEDDWRRTPQRGWYSLEEQRRDYHFGDYFILSISSNHKCRRNRNSYGQYNQMDRLPLRLRQHNKSEWLVCWCREWIIRDSCRCIKGIQSPFHELSYQMPVFSWFMSIVVRFWIVLRHELSVDI